MKARIAAYVVLITVFVNGCTQKSQTEGRNEPQEKVDAIAAMLSHSEIATVEVLCIPPDVETPISIAPDTLEKHFNYKLIIRNVGGGPYQQELAKAMQSVVVRPRTGMGADIRWCVILYDLKDNRVGAIYFDATGKNGAVETAPVSAKGKTFKSIVSVSFGGRFFKWLDDNFSKCFR